MTSDWHFRREKRRCTIACAICSGLAVGLAAIVLWFEVIAPVL